MKISRREAAMLLAAVPSVWAGVGSKDARYVGGTWTDVKDGEEGHIDAKNETSLKFHADKRTVKEIPFGSITSLEYGQKAGRRIGATIGWGVTTLGIAALPMLLSKKRKHYLSIGLQAATVRTKRWFWNSGKT